MFDWSMKATPKPTLPLLINEPSVYARITSCDWGLIGSSGERGILLIFSGASERHGGGNGAYDAQWQLVAVLLWRRQEPVHMD